MGKITKLNQMSPGLQKIMRKMFEYVNADVETFDFGDPFWFEKHTWTQEQRQDFSDWLTIQFMKNKEICKDVIENQKPIMSKKIARGTAEWFILQFGWKNQKEEDTDVDTNK